MFIPLHLKSEYSLGVGTGSAEELAGKAHALGYPAIALTDLENLSGQVRFHQQCRQSGIKAITGVELRPGFLSARQAGNRSGRVVLLARDGNGYRSLCRIVSERSGALGRPAFGGTVREMVSLVGEHAAGIFALSDDPLVVELLLAGGKFSSAMVAMLLVRPDDARSDLDRQVVASRLNIPLVADLDVVFLNQEDYRLHQLLVAIHRGVRLDELGQQRNGEGMDRWLRDPGQAAALFADVPEALAMGTEIADACNFSLAGLEITSAGVRHKAGDNDARELWRLCLQAISDRGSGKNSWTDAHRRRLATEIATFERLGFTGFMLVVAEILAHCRRHGILTAVRGSAVSSLALHLLGGSPVDPLTHGLLFERFLHGEKSAWPDVDIDLPWHRRDEVINWVYQRFGQDRVAMVAAYHTFQHRSALREGLKAWGAPPATIERLVAALPAEELPEEEVDFLGLATSATEMTLASEISIAGWVDGHSTSLQEAMALIGRLVGRPRHLAVHPGGIIVSRTPLADVVPLAVAPKGVVITQYDLVAVARLGLVKIDLLGNRCLSELEEVYGHSGQSPLSYLQQIPLNDPAALALIDRAQTLGCFQLESPAIRSLLASLPIRNLQDVIAALALIRPGVAAGKVKARYIRRARHQEPARFDFQGMADRLQETHGLFLYEEDIMLLLSKAANITVAEADELRSAIIRSGGEATVLAELERQYVHGAQKRGVVDGVALRQAWQIATRLAAYSFNKAHAASYGMLAYFSAYAKAHFPAQFACAVLNHHQGLYPLRTLAAAFSRMGVQLLGPQVNHSSQQSRLEENDQNRCVRVGLNRIKGLSARSLVKILREREKKGEFVSFRNLLERVRPARGDLAPLVMCGACDGLWPLAADLYPFAHEAVLDWLRQGGEPAALDALPIPQPADADAARVRLYQSLVRVKHELHYLGMHLTAHPMALLRQEAERYGCVTIDHALHAAVSRPLRLAVTVAAMRRLPGRQGIIQFISLEDETGLLEAVVLPPVFRHLGNQVTTPGPFLVEGILRRQQGAHHLEVSTIAPFHRRQKPFAAS